MTTPSRSYPSWNNSQGGGPEPTSSRRLSPSPQFCPVQLPSHSREKFVWQSLPSSEPWQTQHSKRETKNPGKWLCSPFSPRATVLVGGLWENLEEELLTLQLKSSSGAFSTFVKPDLGLAASSSSLEDIVGWQSLQCWGLFTLTP